MGVAIPWIIAGLIAGLIAAVIGLPAWRALQRWFVPDGATPKPDDTVTISSGLMESEAEIIRSKLDSMGVRAYTRGSHPSWRTGSVLQIANWDVIIAFRDIDRAQQILGADAAGG